MGPGSEHYCDCCGRRYAEEPDILTEMFRELKPPASAFARAVAFAYVNRAALGRARWQYHEEERRLGVYGDDGDAWSDDGCPF